MIGTMAEINYKIEFQKMKLISNTIQTHRDKIDDTNEWDQMNEFIFIQKLSHGWIWISWHEIHYTKFEVYKMNDERHMGEIRFLDEKCNTGSNSVTIVCEI